MLDIKDLYKMQMKQKKNYKFFSFIAIMPFVSNRSRFTQKNVSFYSVFIFEKIIVLLSGGKDIPVPAANNLGKTLEKVFELVVQLGALTASAGCTILAIGVAGLCIVRLTQNTSNVRNRDQVQGPMQEPHNPLDEEALGPMQSPRHDEPQGPSDFSGE